MFSPAGHSFSGGSPLLHPTSFYGLGASRKLRLITRSDSVVAELKSHLQLRQTVDRTTASGCSEANA